MTGSHDLGLKRASEAVSITPVDTEWGQYNKNVEHFLSNWSHLIYKNDGLNLIRRSHQINVTLVNANEKLVFTRLKTCSIYIRDLLIELSPFDSST